MRSMLPPTALCLIAALAAGCNGRFFASGSAPSDFPSIGDTALAEKQAEKRLEAPPQKTVACQGKECPQTSAPVETAVKAKPALAPRPRSEAAPSSGRRLDRMLARDELEKLAAAHVLLDVPDRMTAGTKSRVEVRFSDELRGEFVKNLQDLGLSNAEEIASASSFRVQLSGDGFKIDAPGDEEQSIGAGPAAWSWDVAPIRTGVQSLAVTLAARVRVPGGGAEEREMPPITRRITVESHSASAAQPAPEYRWLWFVGALLLLVAATAGGVVVGRRQRR